MREALWQRTAPIPFFLRKSGAFLDEEQPRFDPPTQRSPSLIFLGNSGIRISPICSSIGASPSWSHRLGVMLSVLTLFPTFQTIPSTIHSLVVLVIFTVDSSLKIIPGIGDLTLDGCCGARSRRSQIGVGAFRGPTRPVPWAWMHLYLS